MGKKDTDNGSTKGGLRDFLLSAEQRVEELSIELGGVTRAIEVREPSVRIRDGYLKRIGVTVTDGDDVELAGNVGAAHVWLAIGCTYVPGTTPPERVFSMKDEKALMDVPAGAFITQIAEVAQGFMTSAALSSKNSEATQSAD